MATVTACVILHVLFQHSIRMIIGFYILLARGCSVCPVLVNYILLPESASSTTVTKLCL